MLHIYFSNMPYPLLTKFSGAIKLQDTTARTPALLTEIQTLLKIGGFLKGDVNGIYSPAMKTAFAAFKQAAYLEHPDELGQSTVKELLEIDGQCDRPVPHDDDAPSVPSGKQFRLPGGELVRVDQLVQGSKFFSWGEVTKCGARIPENREIVGRIIKTAKTLDEVRLYLGNRKITVTSFYRDSVSNARVGGVRGSRHILGDAADIIVQGIAPHEVYRRLDSWLGSKGGLGNGASFTHIDLRNYRSRFSYGR